MAAMQKGRSMVAHDEVGKMAGLSEYPSDASSKILKFYDS